MTSTAQAATPAAPALRRVLVIIPAYNEAASLPPLIRAIAAEPMPAPWALDVLVVSDGSTDNTAEAVSGLPARLIELPCNLGVGGAVQTGLQYAAQRGYEFAMQVDGDGQHPPAEIPKLLERMGAGGGEHRLAAREPPRGRDRSPRGRFRAGAPRPLVRRHLPEPPPPQPGLGTAGGPAGAAPCGGKAGRFPVAFRATQGAPRRSLG